MMRASIVYWNDIDWKLVHKTVLKLQTKIFYCSKKNERTRMQNLQRILINFPSGSKKGNTRESWQEHSGC